MTKSAIQSELNQFFQVRDNALLPQQKVTTAAFCKARLKLSASVFIDLNNSITQSFYRQTNTHLQRWNGFRVLAVDGTTYHLPDNAETREAFGVTNNQHAHQVPMAMGSVLYDVFQKLILDARLLPYRASEREAAFDHLQITQPQDLLLYDRGYPAFWLIAAHQQQQRHWCMRVRNDFNPEVKAFIASGKKQQNLTLQANHHAAKTCRDKGLPTTPIAVRLLRIETKKQPYFLITSLMDTQCYQLADFACLYHARWQIEESYKQQKSWLHIENFSGKSVLSIQQDFHARLVSLNLTAMAIFVATKKKRDSRHKTTKHRYQINFAQALSSMRNTLVRGILGLLDSQQWQEFLRLLTSSLSCVRPHRHFERKKRGKSHLKYKPCYKMTL